MTVDTAGIRLVLVDDHILFRQGLSYLLAKEKDLIVVGASRSDDAVDLIRAERPDVVLLDSDPVGVRAEHVVRRLSRLSPKSKIIILSAHDDPRLVGKLVAAGARGYVLKSATDQELVVAVRVVGRGPDRVMLSVSHGTLHRLPQSHNYHLSIREQEVLRLVAHGMRNSEIATHLFIAEGTVKRHLTNIYSKLGAGSRVDALKKGVELGLVSFGEVLAE